MIYLGKKQLNLSLCTVRLQCDTNLYVRRTWQSRTLVQRVECAGSEIRSRAPVSRTKACHAACTFRMVSDGMQRRLHAHGRTGSASVRPSRPLPGRAQGGDRPSRALHVHARGMACCMHIGHAMNNDACMIKMPHGNYRRPQVSLSENRRNRRFLESNVAGFYA